MSRQIHPSAARLEQLLDCKLTSEEARQILRHLLTGCPRCVAITRAGCFRALGRPAPRKRREAPAGPRTSGPHWVLRFPAAPERGEP